jgi:hypothetical protein
VQLQAVKLEKLHVGIGPRVRLPVEAGRLAMGHPKDFLVKGDGLREVLGLLLAGVFPAILLFVMLAVGTAVFARRREFPI